MLTSHDYSSSNPESSDGADAAKVDSFFYVVTRLRKSHVKNEQPMFQNEECDCSVGKLASTFILGGMLNSDATDVILYSLREKYRGTDKLIVPRWVTTKILNGDIDGNVRQWFTKSGADGYGFVLFPTFDPSELVAGMKPGEYVAINLNHGRSPEKTISHGVKGRLGALKCSTAAVSDSPLTPKKPIVELIDSDDDAFDTIAGMGRVTRSGVAKGVSPLGVMARRKTGVSRKDPSLQSGNVTSTKRAPRAPIKFCSPVQELHPYSFPHLDKARKLYDIMFRDEVREKYAENSFSMIPQPDGSITTFTGKRIWEGFAPGQMMEGDVLDFLIDDLKQDLERNVDLKSGKRILLSPYFITVVLDYTFFGDDKKEFNVEQAAREFKTVVKGHASLIQTDGFTKGQIYWTPSVYVMNRYRNSIDILDPLPYGKNHRPSKSTYHKDCEDIITRLVQVMQAVYGQAQYNASKQPNWSIIAKRPRFVTIPFQGPNQCGHYTLKFASTYEVKRSLPKIIDWIAEDLYRVIFNASNQMLVSELPDEIQVLAPSA